MSEIGLSDHQTLTLALQLIQSISLAEERTADPRDPASLGLGAGPPTLSSMELPGFAGWMEGFNNLSLQQLPSLPQHGPHLPDTRLSGSQSDPYAHLVHAMGEQN